MRIDFLNEDQKLELELLISQLAQLTENERIHQGELEYIHDQIITLHIKIEVLAHKGMKKNE